MLRVGWKKRSTVRVCDSPLPVKDGWLACDSVAPSDAASDTPDCLHITSKLRFNVCFFLNPTLEACQQKQQTTVFSIISNSFALSEMGWEFLLLTKGTKSIRNQGNYEGIHMGAAEKLHLLLDHVMM